MGKFKAWGGGSFVPSSSGLGMESKILKGGGDIKVLPYSQKTKCSNGDDDEPIVARYLYMLVNGKREDAGYFYCEICKKELRGTDAFPHLSSEHHINWVSGDDEVVSAIPDYARSMLSHMMG